MSEKYEWPVLPLSAEILHLDDDMLKAVLVEIRANVRAAAQAAQPEAVGWVTAVQSFADELELPFLEAKSFLDEVFPQWMADKEAAGFVTLRLDDLTEGDSYGVDGSDFYRCRICHSESGAGMLNNGIKHEHDCPLASAPPPEPMSAPTEAKPAQDAVDAEPKSLNAKIADQLRPFLKPGDKVIWREAFRWHDDNGVMPNHYDGMSVAGLADDFGYEFDWDLNMNHAAIVRASKGTP
ncbi:hypothetical protein [Hydrogenophaga sp.]|uniref:hypothetical protein n=1 Tax=Hydrogenophaga sp. TaxID=1904254 RepID=UPI0027162FF9|nr:hypothetical protein [Hydrogenophaga sp.]MDO9132010.1 hypothetical protein [Hydrogenophaga sp.]